MNQASNAQRLATEKESKEHLRLQLAQYLSQQPESSRSLHTRMKRLEVAGVGIVVAAFIAAMYVSIVWKSVNPIVIPMAWFVFAASVTPTMILVGLDAVLLRAFPPVILPGKFQRFVTGSGAVWAGLAFIVGGLIVATFWGSFAYAVGTFNTVMLEALIRIFSGVVGIGMTLAILYSIFQKITRTR